MQSNLSPDEHDSPDKYPNQSSGDEYQPRSMSSIGGSVLQPRRTNKQPIYKDDSDSSSQMFDNSVNNSDNEDDYRKVENRRPKPSTKNPTKGKQQKRKSRKTRKSAGSADSDSDQDGSVFQFEEDVPDDFGDTTSSSNEAEPTASQDELNSSNSENENDVSNPAKQVKEFHIIQEIIGIREENQDQDDNEEEDDFTNSLYYVKWTGLSFIHSSYLTKEQIESIPGGSAALKKYLTKIHRGYGSLSQSLSIPSLLTIDDNLVSANYFEVDRIIGKRLYEYENDDLNHINIIRNPNLME